MKYRYLVTMCLSFELISCNIHQPSKDKNVAIIDSATDSLLVAESTKFNLDSLNRVNSFNSAKWWIYCWHCDNSIEDFKIGHDEKCYITMGQLELRLVKIWTTTEYVTYYFNFIVPDSCNFDRNNTPTVINEAVTVKLANDSVVAFALENEPLAVWSGEVPTSRLYNPLQPAVLKYIRENQEEIDPWFRNEAERRGILKE